MDKSTKENEESDGRADTRRTEKHSSQIIANIHHIRMIRHDHGRDEKTECEPNLSIHGQCYETIVVYFKENKKNLAAENSDGAGG